MLQEGGIMGNESLFTTCKTCDKQISKSAKTCPQCGAKQKKLSVIHWIVIVFLALILIGIINSPDSQEQAVKDLSSSSVVGNQKTSINAIKPQDQLRFIDAVSKYIHEFKNAKNELQQSALRDQRKRAIANALYGYSAISWVGIINDLETNTEGRAILSVRISPDIEINTWNNTLSDINSNTLIEKGTILYSSLLDLTVGQRIEFSGSFFPSEEDYIEETSLTIDGSMKNPEFLFKFESVKSLIP